MSDCCKPVKDDELAEAWLSQEPQQLVTPSAWPRL